MYENDTNITHFVSFGVKYIPKQNLKNSQKKSIASSIYRTQANNSVMCGYFYIGFIYFMIKEKSLQIRAIYSLLMNMKIKTK